MTRTKLVTMILFLAGVLYFGLGNSVVGQKPVRVASPEWSLGVRNAPVVIEVFSDFECRRCAAFNTDLKRIQAKYGDRVRMVFREFPLTEIHRKAMVAAQAAEAAGLQAKFFEMNDLLYAKADQWKVSQHPEEQFTAYARELKLNLNRFRTDVSGPRVQDRIR